eukprot:1158104-Pelagomonas_calceolata.AAC.4
MQEAVCPGLVLLPPLPGVLLLMQVPTPSPAPISHIIPLVFHKSALGHLQPVLQACRQQGPRLLLLLARLQARALVKTR